MSTADIAIIAALTSNLATLGAGVAVALAYRKQVRVAAPQKEQHRADEAQAASVPEIAARRAAG